MFRGLRFIVYFENVKNIFSVVEGGVRELRYVRRLFMSLLFVKFFKGEGVYICVCLYLRGLSLWDVFLGEENEALRVYFNVWELWIMGLEL